MAPPSLRTPEIPEEIALQLCVTLRRENHSAGASKRISNCDECLSFAGGEEHAHHPRALACPRMVGRFDGMRARGKLGWWQDTRGCGGS